MIVRDVVLGIIAFVSLGVFVYWIFFCGEEYLHRASHVRDSVIKGVVLGLFMGGLERGYIAGVCNFAATVTIFLMADLVSPYF